MKHFFKIFFLSSILSSAVLSMGSIEIIWPHTEYEVGLQQRMTVIFTALNATDIILDQILAVDQYGEELTLCCPTKEKKNHSEVIKTLNKENKASYKVDVTFYCKGTQNGGCRAKPSGKVRLMATVIDPVSKQKYHMYSPEFRLWVNRRSSSKASPTIITYPAEIGSKNLLKRKFPEYCADTGEVVENTSPINETPAVPTKLPKKTDIKFLLN